jgi:molecular chaperone DnaJ
VLRNYLADLELDQEAKLEDVRRAYKRLARRFHPDLNPGDEYAAQSFRRIQEAYEFLNEEDRLEKLKAVLDQVAELPGISRWDPGAGYEGILARGARSAIPEVHLDIWLDESAKQRPTQTLQFHVQRLCANCQGAGGNSRAMRITCKTCAGMGFRAIRRGSYSWKKSCDVCEGRGAQVMNGCVTCDGRGRSKEAVEIQVSTPELKLGSEVIVYKGCGHQANDGKSRGDVWVKWALKK